MWGRWHAGRRASVAILKSLHTRLPLIIQGRIGSSSQASVQTRDRPPMSTGGAQRKAGGGAESYDVNAPAPPHTHAINRMVPYARSPFAPGAVRRSRRRARARSAVSSEAAISPGRRARFESRLRRLISRPGMGFPCRRTLLGQLEAGDRVALDVALQQGRSSALRATSTESAITLSPFSTAAFSSAARSSFPRARRRAGPAA